MAHGLPDFIATVTYLPTEEGGRKNPVYSGYRPLVKFEIGELYTSGQQVFIGTNSVKPGEAVEAEITILSKEAFQNCLYVGMKFNFMETPKQTLGTGVITKVINNELQLLED